MPQAVILPAVASMIVGGMVGGMTGGRKGAMLGAGLGAIGGAAGGALGGAAGGTLAGVEGGVAGTAADTTLGWTFAGAEGAAAGGAAAGGGTGELIGTLAKNAGPILQGAGSIIGALSPTDVPGYSSQGYGGGQMTPIPPQTVVVDPVLAVERGRSPEEIDALNRRRRELELAYSKDRALAEARLIEALGTRDVAMTGGMKGRLENEPTSAERFVGKSATLGQSRHWWP